MRPRVRVNPLVCCLPHMACQRGSCAQGDPYPGSGRTNRGGSCRCSRPAGARLAASATKAGSGRSNGSAPPQMRRSGGPAATGVPLVVAPISFVSEHSETLVELDLDYRDLAEAAGVPAYHRVADSRRRARVLSDCACHDWWIAALLSSPDGLSPLAHSHAYPWIKSLHIVSMVAWMAGLLYLPRLFVYHSTAPVGSDLSETFKVMERRLLRGIMTPAMIATWLFGLVLAGTPGVVDWRMGWIWAKFALVVALNAFHSRSRAGELPSPPTATSIRRDFFGSSTSCRRWR